MEGQSHKIIGYVPQDASLRGTLLSQVEAPMLTDKMISTPESNSRVLPDPYIRVDSDGMAVDCRITRCSSSTLGHRKSDKYVERIRSWIDQIDSHHLIIGGGCTWSFILIVILLYLLYKSNKN